MVDALGQNQAQMQSVQVPPNYSGVNIQIFNPSVNPTTGATSFQTSPSGPVTTGNAMNPAYPGNYYMQNYAQPIQPNRGEQFQMDQNKAAQPPQAQMQPAQSTAPAEKKKTETREVVELTDDYVKNIEKYLNDQDKQVRLLGAKEVSARLQEDKTRKNDEALNALVNKMLQDPYQPIRFMAIGLVESRLASGNNQTVQLLQQIESAKSVDGQDELKASTALLKMSGSTIKKEFEVEDKPKVAEAPKKHENEGAKK